MKTRKHKTEAEEHKTKVLLVSMPNTSGNMKSTIIGMPNMAVLSIASNLEDCDARVLDLVCARKPFRALKKEMDSFQPDVVGLSSMTFQYHNAVKMAGLIKNNYPDTKIALGGYHATLKYDEICKSEEGRLFDFMIRHEGEAAFNMLVKSLKKNKKDFSRIPNLSYRKNGKFLHNPAGKLLDLSKLKIPNRDLRVFRTYNFLGSRVDVVETSRGCTYGCRFCSINRMYGKTYRAFPLERIIEELKDIKKRGAEEVLIVDDNVTLNPERFERLCGMIIEEGLNDIRYIVQASVRGMTSRKGLAEKMKDAGFYMVFLGIENPLEDNLRNLGKDTKTEEIIEAVTSLKKQKIMVVGGFIIANPDDDEERIRNVFRFAKKLRIDLLYMQFLIPYPGTEIRGELLRKNLVLNKDDYRWYDGFSCSNVRTNHLGKRELEKIYSLEHVKYYLNPKGLLQNQYLRRFPGVYLACLARDFIRFLLVYLGREMEKC